MSASSRATRVIRPAVFPGFVWVVGDALWLPNDPVRIETSVEAARRQESFEFRRTSLLSLRGKCVVLNETDDLVVAGRKRNFEGIPARRNAHGFQHVGQDGI